MVTRTKKNILKKVAKSYAASILCHIDAGVTKYDTTVPIEDLDYIIAEVRILGRRITSENIAGDIDTIYNLVVSQKQL